MRFRVYASAMLLAGSAVVGAQKITTPEELDKIMKKAGPAMQASGKAAGAGNYTDVRAQLAIMKQVMVDSQSFWVEHKREDAIKFNKDSIAKIDEVDKTLSTPGLDAAAGTAAVKSIGATCRACHQVYRAQDAQENFIIKPGSMGG